MEDLTESGKVPLIVRLNHRSDVLRHPLAHPIQEILKYRPSAQGYASFRSPIATPSPHQRLTGFVPTRARQAAVTGTDHALSSTAYTVHREPVLLR